MTGMQVRCRDYNLRIWIEQDEICVVAFCDGTLTVMDACKRSRFVAHPVGKVIDGKPTFPYTSPYDGKRDGKAGYPSPRSLKTSRLEMLP